MYSFFNNHKSFVVVGVSRKSNSFSRKAYDFLLEQGCQLYPVNPHLGFIGEKKCYKSIEEVPAVDAAIFFTNPEASEALLSSCQEKGIKEVLFQFGSVNKQIVEKANKQGLKSKQSCVFLNHPNSPFPHNVHRFIHGVVKKS